MKQLQASLGVLMLDLEGATLSALEQELLQRPSVGGVILFSRNVISKNQLQDLIAAVRDCRPDILIAVDQEGGRVQRLRDGFLELPALYAIAAKTQQESDPATIVAKCGWAMAAEVLHFGIDFSFAPVLDLYHPQSPVIKERAFSAQPQQVTALARAYIDGMHAAGMAATGKHYPGHGSVLADSHLDLPIDERSVEELMANDFQPFAQCIEILDAVMPAHVIYPAVDSVCAGFSSIWIQQKLRVELKFDGVVFSDDLSMAAAVGAGSPARRAEMALNAGCDMVLVCNDRPCALEVADWLEANHIPANARLSAMRARPAAEISNLYSEPKWMEAKSIIDSIRDNTQSR